MNHTNHGHNFVNSWSIFKILSLLHSELNLWQNCVKISHHTLCMLLHYLVKLGCSKIPAISIKIPGENCPVMHNLTYIYSIYFMIWLYEDTGRWSVINFANLFKLPNAAVGRWRYSTDYHEKGNASLRILIKFTHKCKNRNLDKCLEQQCETGIVGRRIGVAGRNV